eukprot:1094173-Pelagomonas_calceolata.AAC.2
MDDRTNGIGTNGRGWDDEIAALPAGAHEKRPPMSCNLLDCCAGRKKWMCTYAGTRTQHARNYKCTLEHS